MDELAATTVPGALTEQVNAFTVDVEDYFHVAALSSAVSRESWSLRESRVEANTERLMQVLAEHDVRATFFVLGWVGESIPSLVRRIADAGHEIACHGYSHQLVYTQTAAEFREETVRAKSSPRGHDRAVSVLGYRAASFSVTRQSLWALDVLIDLGFRYDSSIFPIHHDLYGLPGATPEPHRVSAPSGRTLAEFPMSAASFFGVQVPVSGGGYFRILPYWLTRAGLRQINEPRRAPVRLLPASLGARSRTAAHQGRGFLALPPLHESFALRGAPATPARRIRLHVRCTRCCSSAGCSAPSAAATRPLRPLATGPLVHATPAGRLIRTSSPPPGALAASMFPPCSGDRARGDRKPQPLPARAAMLARGIDPVERLEDQPQVLLRHARALDRAPRLRCAAPGRRRGRGSADTHQRRPPGCSARHCGSRSRTRCAAARGRRETASAPVRLHVDQAALGVGLDGDIGGDACAAARRCPRWSARARAAGRSRRTSCSVRAMSCSSRSASKAMRAPGAARVALSSRRASESASCSRASGERSSCETSRSSCCLASSSWRSRSAMASRSAASSPRSSLRPFSAGSTRTLRSPAASRRVARRSRSTGAAR